MLKRASGAADPGRGTGERRSENDAEAGDADGGGATGRGAVVLRGAASWAQAWYGQEYIIEPPYSGCWCILRRLPSTAVVAQRRAESSYFKIIVRTVHVL